MNWRGISRRLGQRFGANGRMLCSVAYERDWQGFIRAMDAFAVLAWSEYAHCRRCWVEEAEVPEPAERARRAGL